MPRAAADGGVEQFPYRRMHRMHQGDVVHHHVSLAVVAVEYMWVPLGD